MDARRPYAARRNVVDQRFKAAGGFRANAALSACYARFVREVVAPIVADPRGLLYQARS